MSHAIHVTWNSADYVSISVHEDDAKLLSRLFRDLPSPVLRKIGGEDQLRLGYLLSYIQSRLGD